MGFIEIIKAIIFGVIEGITEWLPVSSTGHLILLDEFLSLNVAPSLDATFADEYMSMFEVVIQLGAILAVVVMFFGKLNPFAPSKRGHAQNRTAPAAGTLSRCFNTSIWILPFSKMYRSHARSSASTARKLASVSKVSCPLAAAFLTS